MKQTINLRIVRTSQIASAFIVVLVFLLYWPAFAFAGTCWNGGYDGTTPWTVLNGRGGSPSAVYADVNYCVNTVAAAGDTVLITATGSVNWESALNIDKALILTGPGAENLTIKNTQSPASAIKYIIRLQPSNYTIDNQIEVSGFTFDANAMTSMQLGEVISAPFTKQTKVRIHHNVFIDSTISSGKAIYNRGTLYGVVDNNTFTNMWFPIEHSGGSHSHDWWNPEHADQSTFILGSANYMYFEDNTFDAGTNTTSTLVVSNGQYSARYVFRYNLILPNTTKGSYNLWELHGTNLNKEMEPCFGAEIYGNDVTVATNVSDGFFKQRSGQTRVFYNRYTTLNGVAAYYFPYNNPAGEGYDNCPLASGSASPESKLTQNSYWWGNWTISKGVPKLFIADLISASNLANCGSTTNFPRYGRDVFSDYTPYTGLTGSFDSVHVTCGKLSNLPSTCTVGQGYWATNQSCNDLTGMVGKNPTVPISGSLYKCVSTNSWSVDGDGITYTPYTYPHPLRVQKFHGNVMIGGAGLFN